ncbi:MULTISPECIES: glycosyltransferase [Cycloclasticus]|uniref:glycosyltransferase n=1 Tax=Cycloclasticus TaxID=34067 RepID=UPI0018DDB075|nr:MULTISPECIES: glycosyltransferase [Cycloclasticus]
MNAFLLKSGCRVDDELKISIAVPSYNYACFLEEALASIKRQYYANYEVLIADGGSVDGSLEIIERFCGEDERFRLISKKDAGQADAISKAFQFASGDILCFLNADDCYLDDDVFGLVVNAFKLNRSTEIISFGGAYIDIDGNWMKRINYRYHPLDSFDLMPYRTAVIQPATFWKRHVYDENVWPKEFNYVFDVVFFYNAFLKHSWLEVSNIVAGYRLHDNNKSLTVRSSRVFELAAFERIKFGEKSFRAQYLFKIARILQRHGKRKLGGLELSKAIYFIVNTVAYISVYRLPSI